MNYGLSQWSTGEAVSFPGNAGRPGKEGTGVRETEEEQMALSSLEGEAV